MAFPEDDLRPTLDRGSFRNNDDFDRFEPRGFEPAHRSPYEPPPSRPYDPSPRGFEPLTRGFEPLPRSFDTNSRDERSPPRSGMHSPYSDFIEQDRAAQDRWQQWRGACNVFVGLIHIQPRHPQTSIPNFGWSIQIPHNDTPSLFEINAFRFIDSTTLWSILFYVKP